MQQPMKGLGSVAAGAICQQILSFVILVFVTRSLGAPGYGELVTIIAVATTIFTFSTQWATPYIIRTESVRFSNTKALTKGYLIPSLVSGLILVVIALALSNDLMTLSGAESLSPALVIVASLAFFFYQMSKIGLQVQGRFGYYGLVTAADKVLLLMLLAGLAFHNNLSAGSVQWAYVVALFVSGFAGLAISLYRRVTWSAGDGGVRAYFRSVLPTAGSVLLLYFSSQPFLILLSRGDADAALAGWVGIGFVVVGILLQPFTWLAPSLLPTFSVLITERRDKEVITTYLNQVALPAVNVLVLTIAAVIAVLALAPNLLDLLGSGFDGGAGTVSLVVLLAASEAANLTLVPIMYAKKAESLVMLAMTVKALPLLLGYAFGSSMEVKLILLGVGGWLAIAVFLYAIRSYLDRTSFSRWVIPFVSMLTGTWLCWRGDYFWMLAAIVILLTIPALRSVRQLWAAFGFVRGGALANGPRLG